MNALTTIIKEYKNINIFLILEKQFEMSTIGYKETMEVKIEQRIPQPYS